MIAVAMVSSAAALGTWAFGWLALPAIGLVVGAGRISARPVATAASASLIAWAALLAYDAATGPVAALADLLGGVLGVSGALVIGLTLAYPAVVAGAAAGVGAGLRSLTAAKRSRPE